MPGLVVRRAKLLRGDGHSDGVGDSLSLREGSHDERYYFYERNTVSLETYERSGRHFNANILLDLRVSGSLRRLEVARVVALYFGQGPRLVSSEVKHDVLEKTSMPRGAGRRIPRRRQDREWLR